jgi:alcohol dehydrogenase class IV
MAIAKQVFGFYIPTVNLMGVGAHKQLGERVKTLGGKNVFIVTDKGITGAGITDQIREIVEKDAWAKVAVFDDTIPNPTDKNVQGLSERLAAEKALEAIKTLSLDVGIPSGLKELGVKEKDLKTMAENAQLDACGFTNPRCPKLEDVIEIYKWAM